MSRDGPGPSTPHHIDHLFFRSGCRRGCERCGPSLYLCESGMDESCYIGRWLGVTATTRFRRRIPNGCGTVWSHRCRMPSIACYQHLAFNPGQMLDRVRPYKGIGLVNVVRSTAQSPCCARRGPSSCGQTRGTLCSSGKALTPCELQRLDLRLRLGARAWGRPPVTPDDVRGRR